MLREKTIIDRDNYLDMFERKFTNFCEKNILNLEFTIYPDYVEVEDFSGLMSEVLTHEFDFSEDVRRTIYKIGRDLKRFYPKFYDTKEKLMSTEEMKDFLRTHTPDEIDLKEPEFVNVLAYTVYRVNNLHNEINVIDHNDGNRKKAYKLSIPAIEFINTLYDDSDVAYNIFKRKARYVGLI